MKHDYHYSTIYFTAYNRRSAGKASRNKRYALRFSKFLSTCPRVKTIFAPVEIHYPALKGSSIGNPTVEQLILTIPSSLVQNKSLVENFSNIRRLQLLDTSERLFRETDEDEELSGDESATDREALETLLGQSGLLGVEALDLNIQVQCPGDLWYQLGGKAMGKDWASLPMAAKFINKLSDLREFTIRMEGTSLERPNAYDLVSQTFKARLCAF